MDRINWLPKRSCNEQENFIIDISVPLHFLLVARLMLDYQISMRDNY